MVPYHIWSKIKYECTLTNLVLDLISHTWHFVQQTQRLIHPLIDYTQVGQNLEG